MAITLDYQELANRIIDISYQEQVPHLSSNMSALVGLIEIYSQKSDDEIFILSNGHAGLALYVILEKIYGIDAVMLLQKHGIHPGKDLENKLYCSTGSLGSGLPIAIGHALADPNKKVYCMVSDGECGEGSIWESLRYITDNQISNIEVYANINGQGEYSDLEINNLVARLCVFMPNIKLKMSRPLNWPFASGLLTHHYVLTEQDYNIFLEQRKLKFS